MAKAKAKAKAEAKVETKVNVSARCNTEELKRIDRICRMVHSGRGPALLVALHKFWQCNAAYSHAHGRLDELSMRQSHGESVEESDYLDVFWELYKNLNKTCTFTSVLPEDDS